jgi:hypothetical protein
MDKYYVIVLSIAIILLILLLTYIGILMTNSVANDKANLFPPIANTCPDYWSISVTDSSACVIPNFGARNVGIAYDSTGKLNTSVSSAKGYGVENSSQYKINFNDVNWASAGKVAICAQKDWANKNNILWDGVSNYNGC